MIIGTIEHELALENSSRQEGYDRYIRSQERLKEDQGFASTSSVSKVIKGAIPLVAQDIESYLGQDYGTRTPDAISYLKDLDVHLLSFIGLSAVFNGIARDVTITQVSIDAGRFVENELWSKALQTKDKALHQRLVSRVLRTHGNVKYRVKAIRSTAKNEGFKHESLPNEVRAKIGAPLVNSVLKVCEDLFEIVEHDKDLFVGLTEEGHKYLVELHELEAWMHPVFKPMVIPPKPWVSFDTGCYHSEALSRNVKLVRTSSKDHRDMVSKAIASGVMQPCLEALNTIQGTPWRINRKALEVVRWAWEQGVSLPSFPPRNPIPRPPRPSNWDSLSDDQKKGWRIKVSNIAKRNRGIVGEALVITQDLKVAEDLSQFDRFYVPHSLDFRGRVYPVCHFSQQRSDYVRCLLEFADGVPLGADGLYWLSVHLANCGDFNKMSKRPLDERVQWVLENREMITKVARDPKGTFDYWKEADAPLQFVAAAMDWASAAEDPNGYVSHLPVSLDGSNSGLQHYSALLRSPEGALVNLVASEVPADVYQVVADRAKTLVERDAAAGNEVAKVVLRNGVNRKLVKRNVMTFAYSSEQYGFAEQQREDLMKPLALKVLEGELKEHPYAVKRLNKFTEKVEPDGGFAASVYIAKVVWAAVNDVVKDASRGMEFFQKCAKALAHEMKPLHWYSPVGMPVLHKYVMFDVKQVQLWLYDKNVTVPKSYDKLEGEKVIRRIQVNIRQKPTSVINKDKAVSAVAPNIIHSLDAGHLMLTVLEAHEVGIDHFSLIHDSFGTHAGNTTKFFQIIRECFVDMYQQYDPVEEIYNETKKALSDKSKVPEQPIRGNLNLEGVIDSLYAFA